MCQLDAEQTLLAAAIAGDSSATERLLFSYFSPLEQHIASKLPDRAGRHFGVEDILQVTFAEVFRDIARFQPRGEGSFFAWVRTIADHRLIDALRKIDRVGTQHLSMGRYADANSLCALIDVVSCQSDSPSKLAGNKEAIRAIQIAIANLPEEQQEVVRLHFLDQRPVEQIARETGRTEGAVRGLVSRGKKNLADAMGRSSRWLSSG